MRLLSWSLSCGLSVGLKDHAALQVEVLANGMMEEKHLDLDDDYGAMADGFPVEMRGADAPAWRACYNEQKFSSNRNKQRSKLQKAADEAVDIVANQANMVGEQIRFRNVIQGKCLSASNGVGGILTFSECDDSSLELLWTKRADGLYESAAHPGQCAGEGDGVRCQRKYVTLGECTEKKGFIMASGFGLLLKMGGSCLGTWTHDLYRVAYDGDSEYEQWTEEVNVTEEFKDKVMTYHCDGHYTGQLWERVPIGHITTTTTTTTATIPIITTTTPPPTCRRAISNCRMSDLRICGVRSKNQDVDVGSSPYLPYVPGSDSDAEVLAGVLADCEGLCADDIECVGFYFLKDKTSDHEFCRFFKAEPAPGYCEYVDPKGYAATNSDESQFNVCIYQDSSSQVFGQLGLCDANLGASEVAAKAAKEARRAAEQDADRERKDQERVDKIAAEQEAAKLVGEVGEQIKFRNVLQDECLAASDGENGNLTFSNCNDNSNQLLWTKLKDGSYVSAAYPGQCAREGAGARCRREYVELGNCTEKKRIHHGFTLRLTAEDWGQLLGDLDSQYIQRCILRSIQS